MPSEPHERDHSEVQGECRRTRLAESGLARVDACECGLIQIHIGAITLRMEPAALDQFVSTLEQALRAQAKRRFDESAPNVHAFGQRQAGDA